MAAADRASSHATDDHAPLGPPIVVNRPGRAVRPPIRIVVFNAMTGRHFDGIAACLKHPPLSEAAAILFCEVDWQMRRSGGRRVAAELAEALGMSFAYIPEFGRTRSHDVHSVSSMGNAILCAEPFEQVNAIAIPRPRIRGQLSRMRRRGADLLGTHGGLAAHARFAGHRLAIGVLHLHSRCSPVERERQMAAYLEDFPRDCPAVFGGDLNTTTMELTTGPLMLETAVRMLFTPYRFRAPQQHEPLFERIEAHGFTTHEANVPRKSTFTFHRAIPPQLRPKLDWIAMRGVRPVAGSARVVPARYSFFGPRVSDHDFIMVDIDF
jgi:endonuclease/exonuclease/phosphatase family metal-dependent hydrolase